MQLILVQLTIFARRIPVFRKQLKLNADHVNFERVYGQSIIDIVLSYAHASIRNCVGRTRANAVSSNTTDIYP